MFSGKNENVPKTIVFDTLLFAFINLFANIENHSIFHKVFDFCICELFRLFRKQLKILSIDL